MFVDAVQCFCGGVRFQVSNSAGTVKNLPVEVGYIDPVKVADMERANPRGSKIREDRAPEPAGTGDKNC